MSDVGSDNVREIKRLMSELAGMIERCLANNQPLPPALRPINTDVQVPANTNTPPAPVLSGLPPVYTTKEVGKYLRKTPRTIERWCRSGKIKASRDSGEWLIPRDEAARVALNDSARLPPKRATPSTDDEANRILDLLRR